MNVQHTSNTEVSITMTDEEALCLANLLHAIDGTGPHMAVAFTIRSGLKDKGIIGGVSGEVVGRLNCR